MTRLMGCWRDPCPWGRGTCWRSRVSVRTRRNHRRRSSSLNRVFRRRATTICSNMSSSSSSTASRRVDGVDSVVVTVDCLEVEVEAEVAEVGTTVVQGAWASSSLNGTTTTTLARRLRLRVVPWRRRRRRRLRLPRTTFHQSRTKTCSYLLQSS